MATRDYNCERSEPPNAHNVPDCLYIVSSVVGFGPAEAPGLVWFWSGGNHAACSVTVDGIILRFLIVSFFIVFLFRKKAPRSTRKRKRLNGHCCTQPLRASHNALVCIGASLGEPLPFILFLNKLLLLALQHRWWKQEVKNDKRKVKYIYRLC